jgi:translation initiation factor RLI1
MKIKFLTLLVVLFAIFSLPSFAAMRKGVKLKANGKTIDINIGHLVPCVTDWNNDGKKDLIVGQFSGGKIRLYLNYGTDSNPEFKDFSYLHAGGKEISLPAG